MPSLFVLQSYISIWSWYLGASFPPQNCVIPYPTCWYSVYDLGSWKGNLCCCVLIWTLRHAIWESHWGTIIWKWGLLIWARTCLEQFGSRPCTFFYLYVWSLSQSCSPAEGKEESVFKRATGHLLWRTLHTQPGPALPPYFNYSRADGVG